MTVNFRILERLSFNNLDEYEIQSVVLFRQQCQVYYKFLLWCLTNAGYVWVYNIYRMRSFYAPKIAKI